MPRGSLSLGYADGPPCDTWHRLFHLGGIQYGRRSTFFGYFIAGVCHRMEEKCDSTSSVMSGSVGDAYPEYIRGWRFIFPGQRDSSDTHDLPDPFLPTMKKQTPTTLSTKSPKLSLIFNTRYAWQDTPKSSQIAWRIPGTENHKLRWQPLPEYPSDSHHLAPEGSWLLHHPMSRNHDYETH